MHKMIFGVFDDVEEANDAIADLKENGVEDKDISVIVQDSVVSKRIRDVKVTPADKAVQGAAGGAVTGGALGGLLGFLVGTATITLPVLGPLLIAGPIATALGLTGTVAATATGAIGGALAGGLVGAFVKLGVPEDEAKAYERRLQKGDILVTVSADSESEHQTAENIMQSHNADELRYYTLTS